MPPPFKKNLNCIIDQPLIKLRLKSIVLQEAAIVAIADGMCKWLFKKLATSYYLFCTEYFLHCTVSYNNISALYNGTNYMHAVYIPEVIQNQMRFRQFVMLKAFLSATTAGKNIFIRIIPTL